MAIEVMKTRDMKLPTMLKTAEAAQLINVSQRKMRDMCANGEIKAVKVGSDWRINTAEFLELFCLSCRL